MESHKFFRSIIELNGPSQAVGLPEVWSFQFWIIPMTWFLEDWYQPRPSRIFFSQVCFSIETLNSLQSLAMLVIVSP